METNKHYEAPESILVEFKSEGVLCESGFGTINPNKTGDYSWDI